MLKHPSDKSYKFTTRRLSALWLFACLLWMSAAAPFAHTCTANTNGHDRASISSGIACASCEWLTLERSSSVDVPAETPLPQVISAAFAPSFDPAIIQPVRV